MENQRRAADRQRRVENPDYYYERPVGERGYGAGERGGAYDRGYERGYERPVGGERYYEEPVRRQERGVAERGAERVPRDAPVDQQQQQQPQRRSRYAEEEALL